jgi:hypothetical protein
VGARRGPAEDFSLPARVRGLSVESAAPGVEHVPMPPGRSKTGIRQAQLTAAGAVLLFVAIVGFAVLGSLVRRLRGRASSAREQAQSRYRGFVDSW